MSRLTLGGRKRAGGRVFGSLRKSDKENENGNKEKDAHLSYTPKYTYFVKNLIVL